MAMAFSVNDLRDFLALLREHPEWRDQVRDEIMAEDMRALPGIVRQLGERIDALTGRIDRLTDRVDELSERMNETLLALNTRLGRLEGELGNLKGWQYESKFHAKNRVLDLIRKPMDILLGDLDEVMDARESGELSASEWEQLKSLDFLFRGRLRRDPGASETLVVLEVSFTVAANDVVRARTRADILQRFGFRTIAAAGGRYVTATARAAAEAMDVHLLIDRSEDTSDAA